MGGLRQVYRQAALASKSLDWFLPNMQLYNEAFTGHAKALSHCAYCLQDDHVAAAFLRNPARVWLLWLADHIASNHIQHRRKGAIDITKAGVAILQAPANISTSAKSVGDCTQATTAPTVGTIMANEANQVCHLKSTDFKIVQHNFEILV